MVLGNPGGKLSATGSASSPKARLDIMARLTNISRASRCRCTALGSVLATTLVIRCKLLDGPFLDCLLRSESVVAAASECCAGAGAGEAEGRAGKF